VKIDALTIDEVAFELKEEFQRYKILRDFAEGELPWAAMHPVIALCLGFRVESGNVVHVKDLAPAVMSDPI
jgi:hypothetical protein